MHSRDVSRKAGFMVRDHKMAGEIQVVDQEVAEKLYSASYRKGYSVSKGSMFRKDAKSQSNQL